MNTRRALRELEHLPKRASDPLEKLLKSAIHNAVYNLHQEETHLYVKAITVDGGPIAKRMMPRAFGRGATIRKRMSHASLVLGIRGEEKMVIKKKSIKKTKAPIIREAEWEDIKGEVIESSSQNSQSALHPSQKKPGWIGKKVFRRKVI